MCYHSFYYSGVENLIKTRWYISQPQRTLAAEDDGGDGEPQPTFKRCLCSPTRHPGSFRCRNHHDEYVWGGRVIRVTTRS
ncbi:hypothetical protein Hdeb2414_s0027g00695581 [Helianthus debilis subsp. tardiflorus]